MVEIDPNIIGVTESRANNGVTDAGIYIKECIQALHFEVQRKRKHIAKKPLLSN